MTAWDGLPPEMPRARRSAPLLSLDDETASRLLDRTVDPEDAPPRYAPVATLLAAAAAPARPVELTGGPPSVAALRSAGDAPRRRGRTVRFAVVVGVAVLALSGVAAAATGSLPDPVQSVAHHALAAVGVSVPAPAPERASARVDAPRRASSGPPAPEATVAPKRPSFSRPVAPREPAPVPRPPSLPQPAPRPAPPPYAAALCRAAAGPRIGPTATWRAGRADQALTGLAHGATNIAAYCARVLG